MEAINEAMRLISQVIEILNKHECVECDYDDSIPLLKEAVDKLANCST